MSEAENIIVRHTEMMIRHFCWLVNERNSKSGFDQEYYQDRVRDVAFDIRVWLAETQASGLALRSVMRGVAGGCR